MVGRKKANGGERDLNRVLEIAEMLGNKGWLMDSAVELLKGVELRTASSVTSNGITTADIVNTGGEVAPTPLVKKLVASV